MISDVITSDTGPVGLSNTIDVHDVYHPPSVLQVPGDQEQSPASPPQSPVSSSSSDSDLSPQELRPEAMVIYFH